MLSACSMRDLFCLALQLHTLSYGTMAGGDWPSVSLLFFLAVLTAGWTGGGGIAFVLRFAMYVLCCLYLVGAVFLRRSER